MKKITLLAVVFVFAFSSHAQTPIQEFNFNGTLNNVKNDVSFSGDVEYVKDKSGVANSAIRLTNNSIETSLINLPLMNSSRTISIWVKYNDLTNSNCIWGYESSHSSRYFAMVQQSAKKVSESDLNLTGYDNDVIVSTTVIPNVWYHYVVTYDGLTLKIYRNGILLKSSLSSRKLNSDVIFSIGRIGKSVSINADIDDLKIYDVALTENEVKVLHNSNSFLIPNDAVVANASGSAVTSDKPTDAKTAKMNKENNQKIVAANPVKMDVTKISEIFSTKGLKVFSGGNSIDIGSLPEGTYLLKITNTVQNSAANN